MSATPVSTATAIVTGTACNTSNGTIKITGIGPNTPYHASITGVGGPWITFDPNYTFTGLAPGTYEIILADDASFDIGPPLIPGGCLDTITVIVPAIGGPVISSVIKTNGSCHLDDGTLTIHANGGTGILTYILNGSIAQSDSIFTNLSTGVYQIDVMDEDGCMNTRYDTIINPDGPSVTAIQTPTSCGLSNGVITASGTGGTAPLQYSLNGTVFQNSNVFSGLSTGTYTIWIADLSSCISTTTVSISSTPKPTVTAYMVAASCNNSNGIIIANGASGTQPYQYSINGTVFQSSNTFTGLNAGNYTITIKDSKGCLNSTSISVGNIAAPTITLVQTPATCFNANGSITATGSGGVAPLQYSLNNDTSFQVGNVFNGLSAGSYTVYIKDANGCQSSKNILVTSPNVPQTLTATVTNASCGNNNGSVVASATGGTGILQYSLNGSPFQTSTSFTLLGAGTYPLIVKDVNNCQKTINVTVANLASPTISAIPTLSSCFANDGTITAIGVGGTGALTYSKNGITFQSSPVFTNLAPGTYTITVKDSKNCIATATNIVVGHVAGPTVTAFDSVSVCGENIVAIPSNGTSPFHYSLNDSAYQNSNIFSCHDPGLYEVKVVDANGCKDSFLLNIPIRLPIELVIFTGHTENKFNILDWKTASEINNAYFILEKSHDGIYFDSLAKIDGAGNSNTVLNYTYTDKFPFYGNNYYRLKQTDFNGTYRYSNIILLHSKNNFLYNYTYLPNSNELEVILNNTGNKTIELIDNIGRKIISTNTTENKNE